MRHEDLPSRWKTRVSELAASQSGGRFRTLGARAFRNQQVRIAFPDGSHAFFQYAFYLTDPENNEVAVFTEHCGYHVFPLFDTRIDIINPRSTSVPENTDDTDLL